MNILVSAIYAYNSYSRGIMPDVLQTQINQHPGATIYYLTNSHSFDICYFNINKEPEACYLCKTGVKNTLKLVNGKFHHLKISDLLTDADREISRAFFAQQGDIGYHQMYENFEVGAATLSTYISVTRDRDLILLDQAVVRELAENALALYLATKRFLKAKEIDLVYNFNGRQEYVRAIMQAALAQNIDCYNVERTRLKGHIDFYKNTLPHDPAYKFALAQKYWEESPLSEKEKTALGSSFFERQKSGESLVFPSYTGKMTAGEVPTSFNNGRKNLVLFNSSDDEIAALGAMFKNPFFGDQNEGLEFLVKLVGTNLSSTHNLIIRMHPNLSGFAHKYISDIRNFHQKYPNIFVIDPESPVDTYALMESAEKVVSFGSTTGLEANYIRKPVILLGVGYFYYADYAHKPESKEDILTLLSSDLSPRPLEDTLKVGYYFYQGGIKTDYYFEDKMSESIFFKGQRVHFYTFLQRLKAKLIENAYRHLKIRIPF